METSYPLAELIFASNYINRKAISFVDKKSVLENSTSVWEVSSGSNPDVSIFVFFFL